MISSMYIGRREGNFKYKAILNIETFFKASSKKKS